MSRPSVTSTLALTACLTIFALGAQACASPAEDDAATGDSAQTAVPDTVQKGSLVYRERFSRIENAAGLAVSVTCEGGVAQKITTDAEGEFQFKGPGGGLTERRTCTLALTGTKSVCNAGGSPEPITWVAVGFEVALTLDVGTCDLRGAWEDIPHSL